jgi:Transposase DDE domain
MYQKLQTPYAKKIFKKRGSTVEPVLGTMLNFLNLKRVNTRGIKQANKHVMMAALAYNVKKYLKFVNKVRLSACAQLKKSTAINKINEVLNTLTITLSGNRNSYPGLFILS